MTGTNFQILTARLKPRALPKQTQNHAFSASCRLTYADTLLTRSLGCARQAHPELADAIVNLMRGCAPIAEDQTAPGGWG